MERQILRIAVLAILLVSHLQLRDSNRSQGSTSTTPPPACYPIPQPPCKEGASPGVLQIIPDGSSAANKSKLARKRFYLSSCPFDLANRITVTSAPTLQEFYRSAGGSSQLIAWLEDNNCETIYCRELTMNEAKCDGIEPNKCVPEFAAAYRSALFDLKGNASLALKMITNYAPLSDPKLRIGFFEARAEWLKNSVGRIESAIGNDRIRTTFTDKDGSGFFYDLCPGAYYVSSIAPIDVNGVEIVWETAKPVKVEGPPDMKTATRVTLAFPPSKDKKNYSAGKLLSDFTNQKATPQ